MAPLELNDLNDDILSSIADVLPPGDVVSFALCNKRIHVLSAPRLKTHREYQREYLELNIEEGNWPHGHYFTSPLHALYRASCDPWMLPYVQRVYYTQYGEDAHGEPDENADIDDFLVRGAPDASRMPHF